MEELVREAIKQVPALAVLVFVVVRFLSHLAAADSKREKSESKRIEMFSKALDAASDASERRHRELANMNTRHHDENRLEFQAQRHTIANLAHEAGLQRAIRAERDRLHKPPPAPLNVGNVESDPDPDPS